MYFVYDNHVTFFFCHFEISLFLIIIIIINNKMETLFSFSFFLKKEDRNTMKSHFLQFLYSKCSFKKVREI